MSHWGDIADVTDDVVAAEFAVCLDHAVRISRDLSGRVAAASGSMVFISSVSGLHGAPRHAAYGMAKAALISLVKSLAVELGASGVRANSIAPGSSRAGGLAPVRKDDRPPTRCPRRQQLRIARPQGRDDDHRRHGELRVRPNRPGPSRTERGLEIDHHIRDVSTDTHGMGSARSLRLNSSSQKKPSQYCDIALMRHRFRTECTEANSGARIRYCDNVSGPLPTSAVVLPNCVRQTPDIRLASACLA